MENQLNIRFAGINDIDCIRELALTIWPVAYKEILSPQQLDYMLDLIYSAPSLLEQMEKKHHQFVIEEMEGKPVGFASWSKGQADIWKLHKLYILTNIQKQGAGRKLIDFVIDEVRKQNGTALRLNVNRFNSARSFYEKIGFRIIAEEKIDIGHDYVMDDYVMEKAL